MMSYHAGMAKKKPPPKRKPKADKPLKIPGTFDDLIRQMVTTKKPPGGWPKK